MTVSDVLVDLGVGRLAGLGRGGVKERNKRRTVLEHTTDITLIDCLLKDAVAVGGSGPAVDEVAVHTITGGITLRVDPGGTVGVEGELLNFVDDFVEEHWQVDRVRRGAGAAIDTSRGPCHVRCMIRGIQILAIPARPEVDLSSHASRAVVLEKVISLEPFGVVGGFRATSEAHVRDGGVVGISRGESLPEGVTLKHSEPIGEGSDVLALVARSNEVVR